MNFVTFPKQGLEMKAVLEAATMTHHGGYLRQGTSISLLPLRIWEAIQVV